MEGCETSDTVIRFLQNNLLFVESPCYNFCEPLDAFSALHSTFNTRIFFLITIYIIRTDWYTTLIYINNIFSQ